MSIYRADAIAEAQRNASSKEARRNAAGFVRALYRRHFNREPLPEEIVFHVDRIAPGDTEAQATANFLENEEARAAALEGFMIDPRVDQPVAGPKPATMLRAEDVMRSIADSIKSSGNTSPSFDEVANMYGRLQSGETLTTILREASSRPPPQVSRDNIDHETVRKIIRVLYLGTLHRHASVAEVESWSQHYFHNGDLAGLVVQIGDCEEARFYTKPDLQVGQLIQMAYEIIYDRGASASEVDIWRQRIERGSHTITKTLLEFFHEQRVTLLQISAGEVQNNPGQAYLFGSRGVIGAEEWNSLPDPERRELRHDVLGRGSLFEMRKSDGCAVSILTSLYMGGDYIRKFLENITSQTIFRDHCELIIVDACSPEDESLVIAEFRDRFPNIVYKRYDTRVGIYEAWNIAAKLARGRYCTNANLDDLRREDSLEIQAATLDSLPFVDVTYQEVLYSFEGQVSFDELAAHDLKTSLPIISRHNLMEFNSPHNAPMWRRSLHDDIGYFDEALRSAGDYEFWMRCLLHGKSFYKTNSAHVGYYVNPKGLSTRPDTRGVEEGRAISRKYNRKIISPLLTGSHSEFLSQLEMVAGLGASSALPLDPPGVNDTTQEQAGLRYDMVQSALCSVAREINLKQARA